MEIGYFFFFTRTVDNKQNTHLCYSNTSKLSKLVFYISMSDEGGHFKAMEWNHAKSLLKLKSGKWHNS